MLSGDKHIRVRRTDAADQTQDRLHYIRLSDKLWRAFRPEQTVLGLQTLASTNGSAKLNLCSQDRKQAGILPGLLYKVASTSTHSLDGNVDASPGSHHDDRQSTVDALNA